MLIKRYSNNVVTLDKITSLSDIKNIKSKVLCNFILKLTLLGLNVIKFEKEIHQTSEENTFLNKASMENLTTALVSSYLCGSGNKRKRELILAGLDLPKDTNPKKVRQIYLPIFYTKVSALLERLINVQLKSTADNIIIKSM